jgi:hypothetical protein
MLMLLDRHAGVPKVGKELNYDVPAFHVSRQQPLEERGEARKKTGRVYLDELHLTRQICAELQW